MTEIPKEAVAKAVELANAEDREAYTPDLIVGVAAGRALARYIADVSEKAKEIKRFAVGSSDNVCAIHAVADELILPNPEDDLLKEAREICAVVAEGRDCPKVADGYREGRFDDCEPMRCTLAALRKGN